MRPEEISAAGELAGEAVGHLALQIRDMHQGIAGRVFGALGDAAKPARVMHDGIAEGAYAAARGLAKGLVHGGVLAASAARRPDAPSLEQSVTGRLAIGALNGAFGDSIHGRGNRLAVPMSLRRDGRDVELTARALAGAYPDASPRIAVFVHGLCETEEAWQFGAARHVPYGARLQTERGYTPLYVRYNTGRHISENGRDFAQLLDHVTGNWPVAVDEIVLIGHSMGGLVARSACHYADAGSWTADVRHVFTLGAPHRGAPLERAATLATGALARLPETRGLARALKARSSGIKDLGHGYLVDEDWRDQDPDAFVQQAGSQIPFLESANHYFVAATLSREPDATLGRIVGDLLVLRSSAWAHAHPGEPVHFPVDHYCHVGELNHFDLLNHPAIYGQLRRWITGPALPAVTSPGASVRRADRLPGPSPIAR
jgi:pimeloyl-ACP methyl ester carboxylesterase